MGLWIKRYNSRWTSIHIGPMQCTLDFFPDHIYLGSLGCADPKNHKKGYGTRILKLCIRISRKFKLPLELFVGPIHIPEEKLIEWYIRNGFEIIGKKDNGKTWMRYNPCIQTQRASICSPQVV